MALNKLQLQQQIKLLLDSQAAQNSNPEQSRQIIAQGIADAIDAYVKQATVTVTVQLGGRQLTGVGFIN